METDKAWNAIYRCLTDGDLTITPATNPLGKLIVGGKQLYSDTSSYIINLVETHELPSISAALKGVTKDWMKDRYENLRGTDYPQEFISEQDWEYTWDYFYAYLNSSTAPNASNAASSSQSINECLGGSTI